MSEFNTQKTAGTIVQATTPQLQFVLKADLTGCTVQVYFRRKGQTICVNDNRISKTYDSTTQETSLIVTLTQAETLSMAEGDTEIQAHWIDSSNHADASYPPVVVKIGKILYPHEIVYGG